MDDELRDTVYTRILPLLARAAPRVSDSLVITLDSILTSDLGFDSIGVVTLAFYLEEDFGIDIAAYAEEFGRIKNVRDIVDLVCQIGAENVLMS